MRYHLRMTEADFDFSHIDPITLQRTVVQLKSTSAPTAERIARYLQSFSAGEKTLPPIIFLGLIARDAKLVREIPLDSAIEKRTLGSKRVAGPLRWGLELIRDILVELRKIICGPRKTPSKLGPISEVSIGAIAAYIAKRFHMESATAHGIALVILLNLGRAAKNAFCKKTDAEILAALAETG